MKKIKLSEFKKLRNYIQQGKYLAAVEWARIIDDQYTSDPSRVLIAGYSFPEDDFSYYNIVYYPKGDFVQSYPQCPETLLEAYYDPTTEEFFDVSGRWV